MKSLRYCFCSIALLALPIASLAAGAVKVTFIEPDKFTDVSSAHQRVDDGALKTLAAHFEASAARWVPEGQTLNIDVTDVDLAGEIRPDFGRHADVRVLGKGADWPHLRFRYSLSPASAAAEVRLSDLNYLYRGYSASVSESLGYERRMIDEWVRVTLAAK